MKRIWHKLFGHPRQRGLYASSWGAGANYSAYREPVTCQCGKEAEHVYARHYARDVDESSETASDGEVWEPEYRLSR